MNRLQKAFFDTVFLSYQKKSKRQNRLSVRLYYEMIGDVLEEYVSNGRTTPICKKVVQPVVIFTYHY